MNFNQYQTQNMRLLTPEIVGTIQKRQWRDSATGILVCTICGKRNITGPIVAYFKYKAENLACYSCQASQIPLAQPPTAPTPAFRPPVGPKPQDNPMITERQAALLRTLIIEKVLNETEREQRLNNIPQLTKVEAITAIGLLLKNQA